MNVNLKEKGTIVSKAKPKAAAAKVADLTPQLESVFAKSFGVSESAAKVMARGRGGRPVGAGSLAEAGREHLGFSAAKAKRFAEGRHGLAEAVTKAEPAAGQFKGGNFPASDYGFVPDASDPESGWALLLTLTPGGDPDPASVRAAVAAIDTSNLAVPTVVIPEDQMPGTLAKLATAWKKCLPADELPGILTQESLRRVFAGWMSERAATAAARGRA